MRPCPAKSRNRPGAVALPDAPVPAVGVNGAGRFTITNSPGSIRLYRLKVSWIP